MTGNSVEDDDEDAVADLSTIETDYWKIKVPKDWIDKLGNDGRLYLESEDGTKGFYISTLLFSQPTEARQVLDSFKQTSSRSLAQMSGYKWSVIDERSNVSNSAHELLIDNYDQERCYRIIEKFVVALPIAINAAFHDYGCSDIKKSNVYFRSIIESLEIKKPHSVS